jgi:hypothetical protein
MCVYLFWLIEMLGVLVYLGLEVCFLAPPIGVVEPTPSTIKIQGAGASSNGKLPALGELNHVSKPLMM